MNGLNSTSGIHNENSFKTGNKSFIYFIGAFFLSNVLQIIKLIVFYVKKFFFRFLCK